MDEKAPGLGDADQAGLDRHAPAPARAQLHGPRTEPAASDLPAGGGRQRHPARGRAPAARHHRGRGRQGLRGRQGIRTRAYDHLSSAIIALQKRTDAPRNPDGALHAPVAAGETRGDPPVPVMRTSAYTRASLHPLAAAVRSPRRRRGHGLRGARPIVRAPRRPVSGRCPRSSARRRSAAQGAGADPRIVPRRIVALAQDRTIAYAETGTGPDLVAIHGTLMCLEDVWLGPVPALAEHFRVVAVDRPGHGFSRRPRGAAADIWDQAASIREAVQRLGLRRPVILGHSFGGPSPWRTGCSIRRRSPASWPWRRSASRRPRLEQVLFGPRALPFGGDALSALLGREQRPDALPLLWNAMFFPRGDAAALRPDFPFDLAGRPAQITAEGEDAGWLWPALTRSVLGYPSLQRPVRILGGSADLVVNTTLHGKRAAGMIPGARFERLRTPAICSIISRPLRSCARPARCKPAPDASGGPARGEGAWRCCPVQIPISPPDMARSRPDHGPRRECSDPTTRRSPRSSPLSLPVAARRRRRRFDRPASRAINLSRPGTFRLRMRRARGCGAANPCARPKPLAHTSRKSRHQGKKRAIRIFFIRNAED